MNKISVKFLRSVLYNRNFKKLLYNNIKEALKIEATQLLDKKV